MPDTLDALVSFLIAVVFAPLVTQVAKRRSWPSSVTRAVSIGIGGLLGLGVWALQGAEADAALAAVVAGLTAGGAAAGGVAGWKAMREPAKSRLRAAAAKKLAAKPRKRRTR